MSDEIEIEEKDPEPLVVVIQEKPKKIEEPDDDPGYYENIVSKEEIEEIDVE